MRRNKRCLLAYHRVRAEKLEEMCWKGIDVLEQQQPVTSVGGSGTNSNGNKEPTTEEHNATTNVSGQNSLSPEEEEYFRLYSEMLAAYKGQWTDIDLTGSLEPPKDLFIDVRVLKDAGEIQTEYGYPFLSLIYCWVEDMADLKIGQSISPKTVNSMSGKATSSA